MSYSTLDENQCRFTGVNGRYPRDNALFSDVPAGFSKERHAELFVGEPTSLNHTQTSGPVFRFQCTAGCSPFPALVCQGVIRQAILDAVQLALNASRKLEANPRDPRTVSEFRSVFDHDPALPLPWPGIRNSGTRFARRFQAVAQALRGRGRSIAAMVVLSFGNILSALFSTLMRSLSPPTRWFCAQVFGDSGFPASGRRPP
jgi:hypothetical protein